jgi:four helix bundle protein
MSESQERRRAEDRGIEGRAKTTADAQTNAFEFACKIIELIPALEGLGTVGRVIGDRLVTAGTSIGAHLESAGTRGITRDETIRAYREAIAQARQSVYWLKLVLRTGLLRADAVGDLQAESEKLLESLVLTEKHVRLSPQRFFQ